MNREVAGHFTKNPERKISIRRGIQGGKTERK
jgi:hypothetical protein